MRTTRLQRGAGLLEAMIAMGVLMIGAAGLVGMTRQGTFFMMDSRRTTRAALFAQDLMNQIELWDFDDARLANDQPGNDAALGDPAFAYAITASLGESALDAGLADHRGPDLDRETQSYWNVAYLDDSNGNGIPDAIRIAVIVRWPVSAMYYTGPGPVRWHRVVFTSTKINPGDSR